MSVEHVAYYDQQGRYVGYGEHQAGQEAGHYTKNVFAFLFYIPGSDDEYKGGIMLSVRSQQKEHLGGLIEETAGGTVRLLDAESGLTETPTEAGRREIGEEIGVNLLGELAVFKTLTHHFPGSGKDGLRRHHTALLIGGTDTHPNLASLQPGEIDALLLLSGEAELAALERAQCIPSFDEEIGHLLDFLKPQAGDQDVIRWAVDTWPNINGINT